MRRTFNGKLASIHRGLDYHAKEGTPIQAANAGTVVLARELFYEGNCVIIDHGQQFMTLYMHLSHIQVSEGEKVKQGQQIGLSGATGRATGPHLHVAARWQGAYLDPAQLWMLSLPDFAMKARFRTENSKRFLAGRCGMACARMVGVDDFSGAVLRLLSGVHLLVLMGDQQRFELAQQSRRC